MAESRTQKTISTISGLGAILVSLMAVIGVVVYQAQANARLEEKVDSIGVSITEMKADSTDVKKFLTDSLKEQDRKIQKQQEEIVELKVKVKILEEKNR